MLKTRNPIPDLAKRCQSYSIRIDDVHDHSLENVFSSRQAKISTFLFAAEVSRTFLTTGTASIRQQILLKFQTLQKFLVWKQKDGIGKINIFD
jgi:hypothetical protein